MFTAACVAFFLVVAYLTIWQKIQRNEQATASAVAIASAKQAQGRLKAAQEQDAEVAALERIRLRRRQAWQWCVSQGDVPVLAFGSVICINRSAVSWEQGDSE